MYFWKVIEKNVWNNTISFEKRKKLGSSCELCVPSILEIWDITKEKIYKYLKLWDNIVFEEVLTEKLYSKNWLKNYLVWKIWNSKICIFDNHNLSFYFIWKYFLETWNKLDLLHIDQHSDLYEPYFYPKKLEKLNDIEKYTFEWINVWSWIKPLKEIWFIWKDIQIRTEYSALELEEFENIILDIDLDFWEDNMSTTHKSLKHIKKYIWKVPLVLIATSPYFIDQKKAIKLIYNLLV